MPTVGPTRLVCSARSRPTANTRLCSRTAHTLMSAAAAELVSNARAGRLYSGSGCGGTSVPSRAAAARNMDGLATGHLRTTKFPKSRCRFLPPPAPRWRKGAEKCANDSGGQNRPAQSTITSPCRQLFGGEICRLANHTTVCVDHILLLVGSHFV